MCLSLVLATTRYKFLSVLFYCKNMSQRSDFPWINFPLTSDRRPADPEPPTVAASQKAGKKFEIHNEGAAGRSMRNLTLVTVFDEGRNKWGEAWCHSADVPIRTGLHFSEDPWVRGGEKVGDLLFFWLCEKKKTDVFDFRGLKSQSMSLKIQINLTSSGETSPVQKKGLRTEAFTVCSYHCTHWSTHIWNNTRIWQLLFVWNQL